MIYKDIISNLSDYGINLKDILLVTTSIPPKSSDIDVYCVTKKAKSSVHLFYDRNGIWNEFFIDNIKDIKAKLENKDEIAINFLLEMDFIIGDKKIYNILKTKAQSLKSNYRLPNNRSRIIKYRVKILSTKFFNPIKPIDEIQQRFILNSLSYPIIQLALVKYHILPSSPKMWILQLKKDMPKEKYGELTLLIQGKCSDKLLKNLIDEYAGDISEIHIDKSVDNDTTFLS